MVNAESLLTRVWRKTTYMAYSRRQTRFATDLSFTQAAERFCTRNQLHAYMHHYLHHLAPPLVKEHRRYFSQEMRGFGEDALHAMWWTLLREYKPALALEIGVYRGQVITLWGLIAKMHEFQCSIHGISPFSSAGDAVSTYLANLDYRQDTMLSNLHFGLPDPRLLTALSTDPDAVAYIRSMSWNMIYVDGNHDYNVALADYEVCRDSLAPGGLLIMDDSSLYTDFRPPPFGFAGHPGPSRVVQERAFKELRFLGGVGHNNVFQKL